MFAPILLLRLEGAALLAAAICAYRWEGSGWGLFAALFLAPDIAMLGYLRNPRLGAHLYNLAHTTLAPALLAAASLAYAAPLLPLALIWLAHIGFDRMLGYGLKYRDDFHHTHLDAPPCNRRQNAAHAVTPVARHGLPGDTP